MALDEFIAYLSLEKNYSEHTVLAYGRDLDEFSGFAEVEYGETDLSKINYSMIRSWIVQLVEGGLTNRSINRKIASLKAYYKFLLKTQSITVNPLAQHKALKTPKKVQVPFSQERLKPPWP